MKLSKDVRKILIENKWTISTAESCTGGLLAHSITNSSGSSNYFSYGYITYSDEAKVTELNIPKDIIKEFSSYSGEVAELMAEEVRKKSNSTFGISITGIAPPGDPSSSLPKGSVFIGFSSIKGTKHFAYRVRKKSRIGFKRQTVKISIEFFFKQIS